VYALLGQNATPLVARISSNWAVGLHRASGTPLSAGEPGTVYATFPTAVSMCSHLGQTKVSSS
jgi:hypothetical protein